MRLTAISLALVFQAKSLAEAIRSKTGRTLVPIWWMAALAALHSTFHSLFVGIGQIPDEDQGPIVREYCANHALAGLPW
jgi:hypothetical protein